MFPFEDEEDHVEWDEYGAALGPDEFQLKVNSRPGGDGSVPQLSHKRVKHMQCTHAETLHVWQPSDWLECRF